MVDTLDDRDSDFILKNAEFVIFAPNHKLMARPRLRSKDLRPQRIFFYTSYLSEPPEIKCFTEQEAALMSKSSHGPYLRLYGVSNGEAYAQVIKSCGIKPGARITAAEAQAILEKAYQAELEAAKGHFDTPDDENVHFDESFPLKQRDSFVPPK